MYQKYLVVASKKDKAGINITTQLSQFRKNNFSSILQQTGDGFDFYFAEDEIVFTENLDIGKINRYDFIIFASRHSSEKNEKALTVHTVGNWGEAKFGGQVGKVSKTSAVFVKKLFEKLNENVTLHELKNYAVTMEATHHGPQIEKPCVFIEIGSTENEYTDKRAGFVVAKTISQVMGEFKQNPYNEVAIAIGGPHYCPNFNKIQAKSNIAISHIIPQYSLPLTEEMIKEAIEKTEEEVDFAVLDWKGLGNSEQRQKTVEVLEKSYIQWKKTSDIN